MSMLHLYDDADQDTGRTVFTGWRTVTPGACRECGEDAQWDCDGRGNVTCSCQRCPDCNSADGHWYDCQNEDAIAARESEA